MKEFYANVIVEGEELKCWVRGKIFSMTPVNLVEILHINRSMFTNPLVYDNFSPAEDLLTDTVGRNLEFLQIGNSINVSSLSPELRVLTIIMFNNLYPLSGTGYMNFRRALFLHELITDEEIDICTHIFHILCKTIVRTDSRTCIPFCCLVSRILKLKGIKTETSASHGGSHFTSSSYDEKLDSIMASVHDIITKMSGLTFLMHHHTICCDTKFNSLQTQLDL